MRTYFGSTNVRQNNDFGSFVPAFLFISTMTAVLFFLCRPVVFLYPKYDGVDKTLACVFFFSLGIVYVQALGCFFSLLRFGRKNRRIPTLSPPAPLVTVFVICDREAADVIESTLIACYDLDYPEKSIWLLDCSAGDNPAVNDLSGRFKVRFFQSEVGEPQYDFLNRAVESAETGYVALFAAGQDPISSFLKDTIPFMEADRDLALVQSPQLFSNLTSSPVAMAADFQRAVFYRCVCAGRGSEALAVSLTNMVLRRQEVLAAGGFDQCVSALPMKLHARGSKTFYNDRVYTFCVGPDDIAGYFRQQYYWAVDAAEILKRMPLAVLTRARNFMPLRWLEYLMSGTHYLTGLAYIFLIACSVSYLVFRVPSFFMFSAVCLFAPAPCLLLSLAVLYTGTFRRGYSVNDIIKAHFLYLITVPVASRAYFYSFLGIERADFVRRRLYAASFVRVVWPQLICWVVLLSAVTWRMNRFIRERSADVLINLIWTAFHFIMFSGIFYFNEHQWRKSRDRIGIEGNEFDGK